MKYIEIKNLILDQIEQGELFPNQKLPSERILADSFSTTRITIREALSSLEAESKIYREDRRGWFVSASPLLIDPTQVTSFEGTATSQDRIPATKFLNVSLEMANKKASQLLQLKPFSKVYKVSRVKYIDNRPVAYFVNYISPSLFPELLDKDLSGSLTELFDVEYTIKRNRLKYHICTGNLERALAKHLRINDAMPMLILEKINGNDGNMACDCSIEYWRQDSIRIESISF